LKQPDFDYFECPECEFSLIQHCTFNGSEACPLCASDTGYNVKMSRRTCEDTDKAEGKDARKDG
jgi:hypothetical protein